MRPKYIEAGIVGGVQAVPAILAAIDIQNNRFYITYRACQRASAKISPTSNTFCPVFALSA
jgi:hypothetical protein